MTQMTLSELVIKDFVDRGMNFSNEPYEVFLRRIWKEYKDQETESSPPSSNG